MAWLNMPRMGGISSFEKIMGIHLQITYNELLEPNNNLCNFGIIGNMVPCAPSRCLFYGSIKSDSKPLKELSVSAEEYRFFDI